MREAGRILSIVHQEMEKIIRPGISTMDINRKGEEVIRSYDCIPSFLNYQGYPASICVSVNDEVVHGIPSKKRILKEGDIVSLDMLPIPALDGGRLLFLLIEAVRGKPVPKEKEAIVHIAGIIFLFIFMIFILFSDIIKIFQ